MIWQTAFDALLVVDHHRRYLDANEAATKLFRATRDDMLKRRLQDYTPVDYWPVLDRLWAECEAQGRLQGHYALLRGDGSRTTVEFRATWDFAPGCLLIAARQVAVGQTDDTRGITEPSAAATLTAREQEVLQLAADGYLAPEIAQQLSVGRATVKTHLRHAYHKLQARDRAAAVAKALRRGLIR